MDLVAGLTNSLTQTEIFYYLVLRLYSIWIDVGISWMCTGDQSKETYYACFQHKINRSHEAQTFRILNLTSAWHIIISPERCTG